MIDKLRAEGHSAAEIVNFLLLGCAIKPNLEPPKPKPELAVKVGTQLYDAIPEPYRRGKHKTFSPTVEDIERGKKLFRNSKDAAKLQSPLGPHRPARLDTNQAGIPPSPA